MFIASRLLTMLGLIGAVVGIFFGVKGALTAHDAVQSVNRKGGDDQSLFHAARLDSVLDKVRDQVGADGKLLKLTVYPGYVMAEASTGSEDEGKAFRVQENGKVTKYPLTLTGPGRLADNVFDFSKIDAKTVERLTNQVAAKEHATLDDVGYVVATIQADSGKPGMNVFLKNSKHWRAALDGSGLSNPDQDARKALDNAAAAVENATSATKAAAKSAAKPADDLAACVQEAAGDVEKLQACSS